MKYYKTDSRKISFVEYWHLSGTLKGFLRTSLNKIRGKQLNLVSGIPDYTPFRERIIKATVVPPKVLANLDSGIAELKRLGFNQFWYYTLKDSLTAGVGYGVQALHTSGTTIGKVVFVAVKNRRNFSFSFISHLQDKTYYFTTNNQRRFNPAPEHWGTRKLGTTSSQLWEAHQQALQKLERKGNPAKALGDFDQMAATDDTYMEQIYADRIGRGIWVEMSEAEVAALRAQPPLQPSI